MWYVPNTKSRWDCASFILYIEQGTQPCLKIFQHYFDLYRSLFQNYSSIENSLQVVSCWQLWRCQDFSSPQFLFGVVWFWFSSYIKPTGGWISSPNKENILTAHLCRPTILYICIGIERLQRNWSPLHSTALEGGEESKLAALTNST